MVRNSPRKRARLVRCGFDPHVYRFMDDFGRNFEFHLPNGTAPIPALHVFVRIPFGGDPRTNNAMNWLVSCSCGWSHQYYVDEAEGLTRWDEHRFRAQLEAKKLAWEIRCKFTGEPVESFIEHLLEGTSTGS